MSKKPEPLVAVVLKGIHKEDNKYLQQMVPLEAALSDEQIALQLGLKRRQVVNARLSARRRLARRLREMMP